MDFQGFVLAQLLQCLLQRIVDVLLGEILVYRTVLAIYTATSLSSKISCSYQ